MKGRVIVFWKVVFCAGLIVGLIGCQDDSSSERVSHADIATSTTYLELAAGEFVRDVSRIIRLVPPGMCPAHFDIRPSQVQRLRGCKILIRFDFEKSLDKKVAGVIGTGLKVAEVRIRGGLCQPESYLSACTQIGWALFSAEIITQDIYNYVIKSVSARMKRLNDWISNKVESAGLTGRAVVASVHQAEFCKSMGLKVVATFSNSDTAGTAEISAVVESARRAGVKLVIANRPEGRRLADKIASMINAKVVVFDNFPPVQRVCLEGDQETRCTETFDSMVRINVLRLIAAVSSQPTPW